MTAGKRWVALMISAVTFAASFPPFGAWWLMPVAMGLFLVAVRGLAPKTAFVSGFGHGLLAYGLTLPWMWLIFGPMAALLWGILAAFHAVFALLAVTWCPSIPSRWQRAIWLALAWMALEYIRGEVFWLKFPWATVSLSRGPNILLPWFGVYATGLLLMLGLALVIECRQRWPGAALILVWYFLPLPQMPATSGPPLKVTAIQAEGAMPNRLLELSAASPAQKDFIVWPEYAFPGNLLAAKPDLTAIQSFLKERQSLLVIGAQTYAPTGSKWFNTALTLSADAILGQHVKNHTVHLFDDGTPGTTANPVSTPIGKIGTPICFDCDFQDIARRMAQEGAECFLVPSMDVASWGERQHLQHAELARIRAAENARWMVVASSSGRTQAIDPQGSVIGKLPLFEEGHLNAEIYRVEAQTFFTRYGWYFGPSLVLLAFLSAIPFGRAD